MDVNERFGRAPPGGIIHGPLCRELIAATGYDEFGNELGRALAGLPLIGGLPLSGPDIRQISRPTSHEISELELSMSADGRTTLI